jgi:NADH-quinone oxidoreductase subunit C/D
MLRFDPARVPHASSAGVREPTYLNMGPNHPSTHGVLRLILELDGQKVSDAWADIGYHHRGAEKMGERQSWHSYIPYTDRVDYLSGVMNNFPYVLAVESLAGVAVPERADVIRVLLSELYRLSSHLVFYATLAQDIGMMSPAFWMFTDREHVLDITEAITGARMHANWFRIGGVAQDLPRGWDDMVRDLLRYLPARLDEYDKTVLGNPIARRRLCGVGVFDRDLAEAWGASGPMLRATGLAWDLRKQRPYGAYDHFEFDIPVGSRGDCYDRAVVHVEEMRESLRIIRQCVDQMPGGPYKAWDCRATPPPKDATMHDIETLIAHFLSVSWGPVVPAGEAAAMIEAPKGLYSYYLTSDGGTVSYRTRIRTPSFPHIQMVPMLCRGRSIPDVSAILGSVDYVLADVDR